jgi:pimeloyl-ACP methyl ester carboxylesterase
MFFTLPLFAFEQPLPPIILVPGLLSSQLYVTTTSPRHHWYCPTRITNQHAWINAPYFITPMSNCLLEWLSLYYNESTSQIDSPPGVTVSTDKFGTLDGLMGGALFGLLGPYFSVLYEDLKARGYVLGSNLFGTPYDWRYGLPHSEFIRKFESLIDQIWNQTQQKIVILAHSFGGYLISEFFATAPIEIRSKVERLVLVGPSWGGAPLNFVALWRSKAYAPLTFFDKDAMRKFIGSIPSYYVHLPNAIFSKGMNVITGSLGNYSAEVATDLLFSKNRVLEENQRLLEASGQRKYLERTPAPIPLPVRVLFNSGLKSPFGLHLTNRSDGSFSDKVLFADGDGTVLANAISVLCSDWKAAGMDIECIDMKSKSKEHGHAKLLVTDDSRGILMRWLLGNATEKVRIIEKEI